MWLNSFHMCAICRQSVDFGEFIHRFTFDGEQRIQHGIDHLATYMVKLYRAKRLTSHLLHFCEKQLGVPVLEVRPPRQPQDSRPAGLPAAVLPTGGAGKRTTRTTSQQPPNNQPADVGTPSLAGDRLSPNVRTRSGATAARPVPRVPQPGSQAAASASKNFQAPAEPQDAVLPCPARAEPPRSILPVTRGLVVSQNTILSVPQSGAGFWETPSVPQVPVWPPPPPTTPAVPLPPPSVTGTLAELLPPALARATASGRLQQGVSSTQPMPLAMQQQPALPSLPPPEPVAPVVTVHADPNNVIHPRPATPFVQPSTPPAARRASGAAPSSPRPVAKPYPLEEVRESVMNPAGSLPDYVTFDNIHRQDLRSLVLEYTGLEYSGKPNTPKPIIIQHLLKAIARQANPAAKIVDAHQPSLNIKGLINKINTWRQRKPAGLTTPRPSQTLPVASQAQAVVRSTPITLENRFAGLPDNAQCTLRASKRRRVQASSSPVPSTSTPVKSTPPPSSSEPSQDAPDLSPINSPPLSPQHFSSHTQDQTLTHTQSTQTTTTSFFDKTSLPPTLPPTPLANHSSNPSTQTSHNSSSLSNFCNLNFFPKINYNEMVLGSEIDNYAV